MSKLLISLLFCVSASAEFIVPATPHPVNDYANVLTTDEKNEIATKLINLRDTIGVQVGILVVPTLDGSSIEEASIKVAESWKLGSKQADSGILIMLAMAEHRSRIEIGRGLEGILTDSQSKDILVGMRPYLKRSNVGAALDYAVESITTTAIRNKDDIMTKPTVSEGYSYATIFFFSFFGLLGFIVIYSIYAERKRQREYLKAKQKEIEEYNKANNLSWGRFTALTNSNHGSGVPIRPIAPSRSTNKSITVIAPVYIDNSRSSHDDDTRSSSSSSSSYSSSSNDSSWGGGGGDFSGGGSSDSW